MHRIYLDYNASTPLAPQAAQAMRLASEDGYGNPSSLHWAGTPARAIVEKSRRQVAALLGCTREEIVFTSGGSEANNFALKGTFCARLGQPAHIITTQIEHPAILAPLRFLERLGARITCLPVDSTGLLDPEDLRQAITRETVLISVMHANNEVGTIQPIEACARIAREHGVLFHTDAAQSIGKIATNVKDLGVDMLSIAGHKLYGPKGVGALFVRAGTKLEPLIHGAGHESGRRAGTESAMLTAGLGAACELASDLTSMTRVRQLRDQFWAQLQDRFRDKVVLNGHPDRRLPNTLNVSFVDHVGTDILSALDGIAASTGSACHSGHVELSPVLAAMGIAPNIGIGAVRFSLGRATQSEEISEVIERLSGILV